jgi:EAL domain-containing protein (putative c-di-GMP-specific phosphodiesterase class I)
LQGGCEFALFFTYERTGMSNTYLYLKLLLRNNLLLDLDEYALLDTRQQGLVCSFMEMRLASVFQPVFHADGRRFGRKALLRASLFEHGDLSPQSAFDEALRAGRIVQFDRLVRIIHLMNHARGACENELLFLNVHPVLLSSVHDHGRTFERILHYYSVPTSQVVIEIRGAWDVDGVVLAEAAGNYRSLGYRIALDDSGGSDVSEERLRRLRPDIVKLKAGLFGAVSLASRVSRFRGDGMQVCIDGIETPGQLEKVRHSGADLLQGYQLGRPAFVPIEQPLHGTDRYRAMQI